MNRRIWLPVTATIIFTVALLGPTLGALSSLIWTRAADGNTSQRVSGEIYNRVMRFGYGSRHIDYRARRDRYIGSMPFSRRPCGERFALRTDNAAVNLGSAINRFEWTRLRDEFDTPALESLDALPSPLLGALAACVDRSILGGFCARYVVDIADSANRDKAEDLRNTRAVIERDTEEMWCATMGE